MRVGRTPHVDVFGRRRLVNCMEFPSHDVRQLGSRFLDGPIESSISEWTAGLDGSPTRATFYGIRKLRVRFLNSDTFLSLRISSHLHIEARPAAYFRLDPDAAALFFNQLLREIKAETRTGLIPMLSEAPERGEDSYLLLQWNAGAVVDH